MSNGLLDFITEPDNTIANMSKMNRRLKRFRIWLSNGIEQKTVARFDTIAEVVQWCRDNEERAMLDPYWVECLVDEIEVDTDELMEVWARGERPEDLQMF